VMASLLMAGLVSVFGVELPSYNLAQMISEPQAEGVVKALSGVAYRAEGRKIHVGDHHLEVFPYIEQCGVKDSAHVCGVRFEISVNGKKDKRLTYGFVGIDPTEEGALRDTVQGWWATLGVPLIRSLADKTREFSQSPYLAYPGLMGIRGAPPNPSDWLATADEIHGKIVPVVKGVIDQRGPTKIVVLRLAIGSDDIQDLGCRLDAGLSPELFKAVSSLPWPRSKSEYVFYQTYVINYKNESPK
jgi:hypothetical protein